MLNTTDFPQSRLKQMLADIDKAWSEIDGLYYDVGGDSEEDAVRQSILYDVTKQYETLEVQYIANGKYLMRGNVRYSSYGGDANGQLQCTATATNSIGAKRIKVWIKDLP